MKKTILTFLVWSVVFSLFCHAQTNIRVTNPVAEQILFDNYDPATYTPGVIIDDRVSIVNGVVNNASNDSLLSYLEHLDGFYNRNTGSDTISETRGIGAARKWIFQKFEDFSSQNEDRLVISYLEFDGVICGMEKHKNVFAILPGLDTSINELVLVEGHYDTRCEGGCDTACYTPGMDDNGSGTVLVMELARIMSKYAFKRTIIFTTVTGEDQGLYGGKAWASYLKSNNLPIKVCLDNDVVGGIYCGNTSSPPSCPYPDHVDSTNVRIFSYSNVNHNDSSRNSPHKQLARYLKLQQIEEINPLLTTPMNINIQIREDRVGRGGDHIPFRQRGFTAIRITSQNEHGNGKGEPPDRTHTSTDIIGVDTTTPPDGIIDSFFVNLNYLRRNTIMNAVNLGLIAMSPPTPDPSYYPSSSGVEIHITGIDTIYKHYRVGLRSEGSGSLYFDTVLTFVNTTKLMVDILINTRTYYFTVMNVENGVESIFTEEYEILFSGMKESEKSWGIILEQNNPNPFNNETLIIVRANSGIHYKKAEIVIKDILGREVESIPFELKNEINEIIFRPKLGMNGIFTYSLLFDGKLIETRKMMILM